MASPAWSPARSPTRPSYVASGSATPGTPGLGSGSMIAAESIAVLHSLSEDDLDEREDRIARLYAPDAVVEDPFSLVSGRTALEERFRWRGAWAGHSCLEVRSAALRIDNRGFLNLRFDGIFSYRIRFLPVVFTMRQLSDVTYDDRGQLVTRQTDKWYIRNISVGVPLLGSVILSIVRPMWGPLLRAIKTLNPETETRPPRPVEERRQAEDAGVARGRGRIPSQSVRNIEDDIARREEEIVARLQARQRYRRSLTPTRDTPVSRQPKPRGDPGLESVVMWLKMDALATGAAPSAEQSLQSVVKWLDSNDGEAQTSALTEKKQTPFKERLDRVAENSLSLRGAFDTKVTVVRSNGTDETARHAEQTAAKKSWSEYREGKELAARQLAAEEERRAHEEVRSKFEQAQWQQVDAGERRKTAEEAAAKTLAGQTTASERRSSQLPAASSLTSSKASLQGAIKSEEGEDAAKAAKRKKVEEAVAAAKKAAEEVALARKKKEAEAGADAVAGKKRNKKKR